AHAEVAAADAAAGFDRAFPGDRIRAIARFDLEDDAAIDAAHGQRSGNFAAAAQPVLRKRFGDEVDLWKLRRVEELRRLHPILVTVVAHRDRADIDARIGDDAGMLAVDGDRAAHL